MGFVAPQIIMEHLCGYLTYAGKLTAIISYWVIVLITNLHIEIMMNKTYLYKIQVPVLFLIYF